jgi:hypothetical protein
MEISGHAKAHNDFDLIWSGRDVRLYIPLESALSMYSPLIARHRGGKQEHAPRQDGVDANVYA